MTTRPILHSVCRLDKDNNTKLTITGQWIVVTKIHDPADQAAPHGVWEVDFEVYSDEDQATDRRAV